MEAVAIFAMVVLACAGVSCFFSLAETALFSLSKWQIRELAQQSGRGTLAVRLLGEPQDLLATMVLGNTFANVVMVAVSLWMVLSFSWPLWWTFGAVLILSVF